MSTNPDGLAVIEPIEAGEVIVEPGGDHVQVASVGITRHEIALTPQYTVRGIVMDSRRHPIAGASLFVTDTSMSERMAARVAKTAIDGGFEWTSWSTLANVYATAPGFAASPVFDLSGTAQDAPGELRIVLQRATGTLQGVVVDVAGRPVGGARVAFSPPTPAPLDREAERPYFKAHSRRSPRRFAHADELGRFAFADVPPGRGFVRARRVGYGPARSIVEVGESRPTVVRLALTRSQSVGGRVVDSKGHPVAGAVIAVGVVEDFERVRTRSQDDGRYRLEDLPMQAGAVTISCSKPGYDPVRKRLAASGVEPLQFHPVLRRTPRLLGQLLDTQDTPLAGWAVITAGGAGARTDRDGCFEMRWESEQPPELTGSAPLENEGGGRYRIQQPLRRDGTRRNERAVYRPDPERLPTAHVSGRILGAKARAFRLEIRSVAPPWRRSFPIADPRGVFRIGPISPGSYRLSVSGRGLPRHDLGTHVLRPRQSLDLGDCAVPSAVPLEIEVVAKTGAAPRWLRTSLVDQNGQSWRADYSRKGFHIEPLPPGSYVLSCYAPGIRWQRCPFVLEAGHRKKLRLELQPSRDVCLRAVLPNGMPGSSAIRVVITDSKGSCCGVFTVRAHTLTGPGERLGLPPGTYRATTTRGELEWATQFFVPSSGPAPVEVKLRLR